MLSLSLFLTCQLPNKAIDFEISRKDVKLGTAKMLIRLTQSGGKKVETKITTNIGGVEVKMTSAQEWDFEGLPLLKTLQVIDSNGTEVRRVRVDFKDTNAKVVTVVGGKSDVSNIAAPLNASLNDLGEFWLLRDEPEPKQKLTFFSFDISSLKWVPTDVSYLGEQVKTFGTTKVKLHHIRRKTDSRTDDIWNDGSGILYYSESSDGIKLKRVILED